MAYEQKDNSGSLFQQTTGKEKMPNWKGSIKVAGKEYWISGWDKISKKGDPWVSLSIQDKDDAHSKGIAKVQKSLETPKNDLQSEWDDEINF